MSANYADALTALYPNEVWSMTDDNNYSTLVWNSVTVPKPSEQQLQDEITVLDVQAPFEACKAEASRRLYLTDWTSIADVASPANNPYLMNQAAFLAYRNELRKLAVNPVVDPVWPVEPNAVWSS